MNRLVIYIHGKDGNANEAEHYKSLFPKNDVIGFDYRSRNPWDAKGEFSDFYDKVTKEYDSVIVIANSIGAFFALLSLADKKIERTFLISPIVDMKKLIQDMMQWAGVTIEELQKKREIPTKFGETLSWKYYSYVCTHAIKWKIPTYILYGEKVTSKETITAFAKKTNATLTIMPDGEHWFHTEKQIEFLDQWITVCVRGEK